MVYIIVAMRLCSDGMLYINVRPNRCEKTRSGFNGIVSRWNHHLCCPGHHLDRLSYSAMTLITEHTTHITGYATVTETMSALAAAVPYRKNGAVFTNACHVCVMSCMRVCRKQALSRVKYYYYVINSKIQQQQ